MKVPLRYADEEYELDVPDKNLAGVIEPSKTEPVDLEDAIEKNRLPERFNSGSLRILIIINDQYRSTPSHLILNRILPSLLDRHEVRIIVATGLHDEPAMEEYEKLIGENFEKMDRKFAWSNSRDYVSFRNVGFWPDGGEVYIHNYYFWADDVIIIGSVEPHYFAGFTGGIKSIVPGLSYYRTIEHNHNKAVSVKSQPGVTEGNPVWEELWKTLDLIDEKRIFSYQLVQDSERNIIGLFSGSIRESYFRAVKFCQDIYFKNTPQKCDLLVAEHSPPLDRNLYQLQKCFENTKSGVKDGGTLLMLSGCRDGIGTRDFYDLAEKFPDPNDLLNQEIKRCDLGIHKLYRTAILTNRVNLCLMSFLQEEAVRRIYIEPVADANELVRSRVAADGNLKILVVKDAGHTVINTE
ncbi:MAG TPA: nickel-dependent lactate racemase [candidate division Zixibacteria bacterium]|nr:nickel-dependent lactate racemase [candidate division Zixibacteria bacterium]HEQ99480.1 nickel-dependent lactate racemase [candidate division Zixibacteria bacterium]